jgi:cell division protein FtsL
MSATTSAPRVLTVRRPLVRPHDDSRRLVRAIRSSAVRRLFVLGFVLVLLCLVKVWVRLQVVNVGYELSAARQMQQRLEHERQELEVEFATLRDPRRIEEIARRRLGLTEPRPGQVQELR